MPTHEDGLDGQPLNTLRPIGAQTPIPLEHAPVLLRRLISAPMDATRPIAGAADGGWQGGSRRNRGQSESLGGNLVSIQRTGFSPPPNDRHSPHDGLLPSMPTRPISQGGRPASATTHTLSGVSKRPVSAEIRYYHGRRRHPSRSFDATPWHQLGRPAWDASPPGVRRCSPPYLNPRTRQHSLESFKAEPSPHSCAAKLAHPLPSRVTSAPPRSVPSAVVAAPQADRHRHRPTAQRAGATISGTLHYQHLLLRRPHSPSPSPEPYCHLHHHALPTLAQPSPAPPPQPLTCAPPPLPEQLSKTQHALTGAHMALVDERRKTLSARLDNTRFRVELEATKHARTASTTVATMAPLLD